MAVEIPTARYWRIHFCRPTIGSGYGDAAMNLTTLRLTDSANTPLTHSVVTWRGTGNYALQAGTAADIADTNTATQGRLGIGSVYTWLYGQAYIEYDMGSPVKPAKLLTRLSDTAYVLGWAGGSYTPVGATSCYAYIEASTDGTNWMMVSRIGAVAPSGFNTNNFVALDAVPAFSYSYEIKKPLSGDGGIYGIVAEDGVPVARPVMLFEREFFQPIRRTISTEDGAYSFTNLNRDREYLVMAVDTTEEPGQPGEYKNALVRDRVTPIPANGLPTDGLPWFFRVRRTMNLTPVATWNFYGPGAYHTGVYGDGIQHAVRNGNPLIDEAAGGGYDLRGIPIPVPVGLRCMYTKSQAIPVIAGACLSTPTEWTIELIAEVPSNPDLGIAYFWGGGASNYGDAPWGYAAANGLGVVVELTTAGVINVRFASSASSTYNTVRATGNATPGTLAHILVAYRENQELCLYVNGALAQNTSMGGIGQIKVSGLNGTSWSSSLVPHGYYSGVLNGPMAAICWMGWFPTDTIPWYNAQSTTSRPSSGVVWSALYDRSVYTDPDASGQPISVRDLYESWTNNAVWTGGSRPNGWPTAPTFSGYGIEVAADAPQMWFRMQELDNASYVPSIGMSRAGGYFTGSGVTYQQPGMTAGLSSIGFGAHGALRVAGPIALSTTFPHNYMPGALPTVSTGGSLEFWMRPSALTNANGMTILSTYTTDNSTNLWAYLNASGQIILRFRDRTGAYFTYGFSQVFSTNTAYHVALTWDGGAENKITLYVNGVKHSDQGFFYLPYYNYGTYNITIGNIVDNPLTVPYNDTITAGTYHFLGDLQDIALYSYPLSAARIAAHYAARNT
jgi:hypothetical protein